MTPLSPDAVLGEIAAALPPDCRQNVIIVGSLAAGYNFFAGDAQRSIRTKDVDCMFSPHAKAVAAAADVTERLLANEWQQRKDGAWGEPGDAQTPDDQLPLIRLRPPGRESSSSWFLELLGAPDESSEQSKSFRRVQTSIGHFAICSFNFLALAEWNPIETRHGVRIARPEMMALANMLHHPSIRPDLIAGSSVKRSNKDLGRVLALAWLTATRDQREGTGELGSWGQHMARALRERFPTRDKELALGAGSGLRELLGSAGDLDQALSVCNKGLLASLEVGRAAFAATGHRFVQTVVEPLEEEAQSWSTELR